MRSLIRSLARQGGLTGRRPARLGFTLVELLTVMTVIAILAGLILSISGYATKKGALARAGAEVQALSTACESYKADNGSYPHQQLAVNGALPTTSGTIPSDVLYPAGANANGNSVSTNSTYTQASLELYEALTGDLSCTGTGGGPSTKNYIADIKPDVFGRSNMGAAVGPGNTVTYLSDPFGNSYGYSTAYATAIAAANVTGTTAVNPGGYNPTFDLWSTGGSLSNPYNGSGATTSGSAGDPMLQWVKNW